MGLFKHLSRLGLVVSLGTAIAYEFTGSNMLKAISLTAGTLSLAMLVPYIQSIRHAAGTKEVLRYFRLLK